MSRNEQPMFLGARRVEIRRLSLRPFRKLLGEGCQAESKGTNSMCAKALREEEGLFDKLKNISVA